MAAQGVEFITGNGFPDLNSIVSVSGGEENSVRRVGQLDNPVGVLLDFEGLL